jgi:signal transduction histidine kinase
MPKLGALGLRWKLVLASLTGSALVFALALTLAQALLRRVLEAELGAQLVAVAQATAATLPSDRLVLLTPGDEQSRTYGHVLDRLKELQQATGAARITVVDPARKLLCSTEPGVRVGDPMPELERDRLELSAVARGQGAASAVLFAGRNGELYKSGYAPVKSDDGAVVAMVAVDGSAAFFAPLRALRLQLLALGLLAAALLAVVFFAIGTAFSRPIYALVDAAGTIGKGDLATPVSLDRGDELGVLARSLDQMRGSLAARDRHLQMMLAGVAHEVRNPLGGMELYAGLLAEDLAAQPASLELLQKIRRELDYLKVLVDDFLDFSRERPLALERLDLDAFRAEVVELAQPFLDAKHLTLAAPPGPKDAWSLVDPAALRRVLLNLVKNAAEASPEKGTVTLALTREADALVLQVSDEGPGVPPEARTGLFEPFFTTKEKGTGLGLAFAQKLTEAHGGTLTLLDRAPGAHFRLTLKPA